MVSVKTFILKSFLILLKVYIYVFLRIKVAWKLNLVGNQVSQSSFQGVFQTEETRGFNIFDLNNVATNVDYV